MEAVSETQRRRSRFIRQPSGKLISLTERDLAIFNLLGRYRYLPAPFIQAFVGGNAIRLTQRLGDLFHEGYLDRPEQQWRNFDARYRHATYELGRGGHAVLVDAGGVEPRRSKGSLYSHDALVWRVIASLELAARRIEGLEFKDGANYNAASGSASPLAVAITHAGERLTVRVRPDGMPFRLSLHLDHAKTRTFCFSGIELDRNTEPLRPEDLRRSSILRKILAYREVVATEAYKQHYGFTNLLVPIVTVNATHLEHIRQLILEATNGKGASYLLLKAIDSDAALVPDPRLLNEPWQRAGYPPLAIAAALRA
jgi:hypothetical protein